MFGYTIRQRRQRLGLSMREAARRIGISTGYLVELEHGRNPTTGRAPMPSPTVLAGIGRVLDLDLATLLDLAGVTPRRSAHVLLFQAGGGRRPARAAAMRAVATHVDGWIEIAGPGGPDGALRAVADALSAIPSPGLDHRLGLLFGANSTLLRTPESRAAVLASEQTWEDDVAAVCRAVVGIEPAANVCVYGEADLQAAAAGDPLATALDLVRAHPHVAVEDRHGSLTTGPAAIETILTAVRPAGVPADAWASLVTAAAVGLYRETATA